MAIAAATTRFGLREGMPVKPLIMFAGGLLAAMLLAGPASALDPAELLPGKSAMHPSFGCLYYREDGVSIQLRLGGVPGEGRWKVQNGLYYSTGQCGTIGCRIEGQYPNIVFRRVDGGYSHPATLLPGNHCEKDAPIT